MTSSQSKNATAPQGTRLGDLMVWQEWVNGVKQTFIGRVREIHSSTEAKRRGLVDTKRRGRVLGLQIEGREDLRYKHRAHVKRFYNSTAGKES